jgi:uncharacterized membrane protein YhaH (DUF805 family)
MNIIEAVKSVLTNFANFEGRARRSEYWWFTLASLLVRLPFFNMPTISLVIGLALLIPSIAVAVRRMHDVGKSGWYCLIPFYNLVLACTEGNSGNNQYGADPKGTGLDDEIDAIGRN